jgi:uncharacterized protein (DUF885 family)
MKKDDLSQIKDIVDAALETHLAAVHEEITDFRTEMRGEIANLREEVKEGFVAANSKLGGLDNRIDNEAFARTELETRVRRVVPVLPETARP